MRSLFVSLMLAVCVTAAAQEPPTEGISISTRDCIENGLTFVSIYRLVATPERYDECRVAVTGFVNLEFEGTAVYPHREDFLHGLTRNGLWLDFFGSDREAMRTDSTINGNYVSIVGTFDADSGGHFGLWSGSITRIESMMTRSLADDPARLRQ